MPVALRRLIVVLAVAGVGLVPAPATADGYCGGSGVNVVVDFGALGGGIAKGCDASGNRNAAKAFENTGHPLAYAQRQPGFVCRVNGVPQSDPCVNTSPSDAYWGLYWSDGSSGWKYATTAVGSLTVPVGGTVAFSWQNGGGDPPGVAPAAPAATSPSATAAPVTTPTKKPTHKPATTTTTRAAATPSAATTGSASPTPTAPGSATPTVSGTPSGTPSDTSSGTPPAVASPTTPGPAAVSEPTTSLVTENDDGGGLAWWIPVAVVAALAGAAGAVGWRRRSTR